MEKLSRKELERLKKLELLRKLLQSILVKHIRLLLGIFAVALLLVFIFIYLYVTLSPTRYTAEITMYYTPKQSRNIGKYDSKYVLQMLNSQTTRLGFYEEIKDGNANNSKKSCRITITTGKKDPNQYFVTVNAATEKDAVNFVNTFADLCIKDYIEERTANLLNWEKALEQKKQDIFKDISQVNQDKQRLGAPLHTSSPDKDIEQLRTIMDDQHSNHTKLSLAIAGLEQRQKRLQNTLDKINPALISHAKEIRDYMVSLKALDKEISNSKELYTDKNPKLLALTSRKQHLEANFKKFLSSHKLTVADLDRMQDTDAINNELKTVSEELDTRRVEMRMLDIEIANTNNRFQKINELLPYIQQLNQQHLSLMESLKNLDATVADVKYLLPLVKDDLKIGSKAVSAYGNRPFDAKNLSIGVFSAFMLTAFVTAILLLWEYLFGKVADESEVELFYDFRYLGSLPNRESMFSSDTNKRMAFNTICHMLQSSYPEHHIVMVGTLPGGKIMPALVEAFEWNFAMAGQRILVLDMVMANTFEYVEDGTTQNLGIVSYSGARGFLPVVSKRFLTPTEMELLKQDLLELRNTFDVIFIRHSASLRRDRIFFEQIATLCDGAIVAVGAKRTRRKDLRLLMELHEKTKLSIMTILSFGRSRNSGKNSHAEVEVEVKP